MAMAQNAVNADGLFPGERVVDVAGPDIVHQLTPEKAWNETLWAVLPGVGAAVGAYLLGQGAKSLAWGAGTGVLGLAVCRGHNLRLQGMPLTFQNMLTSNPSHEVY